jgi:soluble lytic murein transglycosylase
VSRAAYWAGRAAQAKGDDEAAVTWYRIGAEHPFSYYGQLSFARLRPGKALELPAPITAEAREAEADAFKRHELVQVVRLLNEVGERSLMRPFVESIFNYSDEPGWQSLTAWLARGAGRPDLAVRVAKLAGREGTALLEVSYPTLELPQIPKTADAPAPEAPLTLAKATPMPAA